MSEPLVAYFSMEIALEPSIPTYSGGLGVLAGDTIRAAADRGVPMVAVTLLHRKGYFYQRLDGSGWQTEEPAEWVDEDFLEELPQRIIVNLEGRQVHVRAWRYDLKGCDDFRVPVYLLDTDLPENSNWDRAITDHLYGGDKHYRLCQEAILGLGGVATAEDALELLLAGATCVGVGTALFRTPNVCATIAAGIATYLRDRCEESVTAIIGKAAV